MATTFNDTLFGQTIFDQLTDILMPLNIFSTDISSDAVNAGSAVVVPLFGNVTATSFVQGASAYEGTGGTISAIELPERTRALLRARFSGSAVVTDSR